MKSALKLFIAVLFILAAVRVVKAQETITISGKVIYSGTNQPVTSGVVKMYDLFGIEIGSAIINYQGDYILGVHRVLNGHGDVIGIPDDEWEEEDYVPTGFPNKIDPALFTHVDLSESQTNIDIYVQSTTGVLRPGTLTTVNGTVLSNNKPVSDAMIYAKQGDEYVAFGRTNNKGEYTIKNIPVGDYILVAHKIGSQSEQMNVTVTEKNNSSFDFSLVKNASFITNTNPFEFALSQNYPNPFNPATVINYSVAKSGLVTLKIYNAAGELVKELVNSEQNAGIYSVQFNGADLSSGVYFYRLDANGFTAVNKMILVK